MAKFKAGDKVWCLVEQPHKVLGNVPRVPAVITGLYPARPRGEVCYYIDIEDPRPLGAAFTLESLLYPRGDEPYDSYSYGDSAGTQWDEKIWAPHGTVAERGPELEKGAA